MLKQRLVTAAVLMVVLAVLLFAAPATWFDAALLLAMAWSGPEGRPARVPARR